MDDISLLFQIDPLKLTREDIDSLIKHYREARERFLIGDRKAGKAPAAKPEKKKPVNLTLGDLDL